MTAGRDIEVPDDDKSCGLSLRLHLEAATVYALEFRPIAQSGPA